MTRKTLFWSTLGIEPTTDRRAIRRAYAVQLKAIDPDADPKAFLTLREAREAALAFAETRQASATSAELDEDDQADQSIQTHPSAEPELAIPLEVRRPSPWQTPGLGNHRIRISELLFGGAPLAEVHELLRVETERLLRHPDLQQIGRAEEIELWLAQAIVEGVPRSDVMIGPAIRRFDWRGKASSWDCPEPIRGVLERYEDCLFRDAAAQPGGGHHAAYRTMVGEPPKRLGFVQRRRIGAFMRLIRNRHPSIELDLSPAALAWWDDQLEEQRARLPLGRAAGVAVAILLANSLAGPDLGALAIPAAAILAASGSLGWFAARRVQQRRADDAEDWWERTRLRPMQAAALAAILLLPLAAAMAPASAAATIGLGILAAALAVAAGPTNQINDEDTEDLLWRARYCLLVPVLWVHAAEAAGPAWMQALIPACAASWAAFQHGHRIRDGLGDLFGDRSEVGGRIVRGFLALAAFGCWLALFSAVTAPGVDASGAVLSAVAISLLALNQALDPPERYAAEWKSHSIFSVLATAAIGPALAAFLVFSRTLRSVANGQAVA